MTPLARQAVAEAIGTFFLCFTGVAAICTNTLMGASGPGLVGIALAHGLALSIAISALGKISGGHFNPAVTTTMVATRQMPLGAGLAYVLAQLIGGTLAGFAARAGYSPAVYIEAGGGIPTFLPSGIGWQVALL